MNLLCICPPSCYKEGNCLDMLICQHEIVKYFMWVFSLAPLENLEIWKRLFFCSTSIWSWQPWETLQNCVHTHTHTHMQEAETQVQFLGWEDALEEGMATHSRILAWEILWTEEPGGLQSIGSQRVRHDWNDLLSTHAQTHTNTCSSLVGSQVKCL